MVSFECNAIYVKDVEDRPNTPKGCNAMYVKDVKDGKRTYTHTFWFITSLIFNGFSIWKRSEKLRYRAFQPFHQIMSQNVCVCSFLILDIFDIHSITPFMCTLSIFSIFNIALIFCTVFNAFNAMYLKTSNIKQCALTHIDTCPLMYTQQIR